MLPTTIDDVATIPALCEQATRALGEAKTIDECRRIGNIAAAWREYLRRHKAAVEAQNLTAQVVLLAEAQIGRELEAAQARGEVGAQGRRSDLLVTDEEVPTIAEAGLTWDQAHKARKLAAAGPERIRAAREQADAERRPLRRADVVPRREAPEMVPASVIRFELLMRQALAWSDQVDPAELVATLTEYRRPYTPAEIGAVADLLNEIAARLGAVACRGLDSTAGADTPATKST